MRVGLAVGSWGANRRRPSPRAASQAGATAVAGAAQREQSGEGQWIQTSLLQAQVAMLDFQAARWLMDAEVPKQAGNNHPTSIPQGVFETKNGFINIAAAGTHIFNRLKQA